MIVKKVATKRGTPARSRARHVRDLCDYIAGPEAGDRDEKVEHRGTLNLLTLDHDAQVVEIADLADLARSDAQPIQHWILSWRSGEQPTTTQTDVAARIFVAELGLAEHHAVYALHRDTDNWHLHLAINRVHPDTERLVTVNGGFDIEVAHRAIARIEHLHGWESECRARYRVDELGMVERRKDDLPRDPEPSTRARDLENRTGEKSAQRTAIEEGADLMRQARAWGELHALLAERGLRFEKRGSGAILWVGEKAVKASSAGRDCSMSALQKRLGDYTPAAETSVVKLQAVEPVNPDPGHWPRYAAERRAHQESEKRDRQLFEGRTRAEWSALVERHQQEKRQTVTGNWKGKGAVLNALRSIVAARQAQERAALRECHRGEQRQRRERRPRWPGFEDWLRLQDPTLADQWRLRNRAPASITGDTPDLARPRDIRAFAGEARGWDVLYRRLGQHSAPPAFTDRGHQILVHDFDRDSILAALQLASQKWGTFRVSGPEPYLRACVELAAEHGFKVANPELQQAIASAQARHFRPRPVVQLDLHHEAALGQASAGRPAAGPDHEPAVAPPHRDARPEPVSPPVRDVAEAYHRHFEDLRASNREIMDVSRLDALVAARLRVTGYDRHEVERGIREAASSRGHSERRDWAEYARRTTHHAFGLSGQRAPDAMAADRDSLLRIEGRQPSKHPWAPANRRELDR